VEQVNPIINDSLTYKLAYWLGFVTYAVYAWCRDFVAVMHIGEEDAGRSFWNEGDVL
jgi:hypothetical protein